MVSSANSASVDLLGTVDLLHRYVEKALCEGVFDEVRDRERRRLWTLERLAEFWIAVILRAPASLTQALSEGMGGGGHYPAVEGTRQGFFERCRTLSPVFFSTLFERFCGLVTKNEPARFASHESTLLGRFGHIFLLDGSSLDRVARRLKALREDRRIPLAGSIAAAYDLGLGAPTAIAFERTPQGKELPMARALLAKLPPGSLCVGDRLYGIPKFFEALSNAGLWGLCRRSRLTNLERVEQLSVTSKGDERIEDWLVDYGTNPRTKGQRLRYIRWTDGRRSREVLTNVLDPARLSAADALRLYEERWSVERMFYDLKEVLNLHRFYAANTNAVAMQLYAAAMVYVAMRVAQGRIAEEAKIEPEAISPKRLFPKVAAASSSLTNSELAFEATCQVNPHVTLKKPDWRQFPFTRARVVDILRETRDLHRRRRPRCPAAERCRPLPRPPRRPTD